MNWVIPILAIVNFLGLMISIYIGYKIKCNDLHHVQLYLTEIKGDIKDIVVNITEIKAKVAKIEGKIGL